MLLNGEGGARHMKNGGEWTRKAVAQNHAGAEKNVGWMYREATPRPHSSPRCWW